MKNDYRVYIHRLNGKDMAITVDPKESKKLLDELTTGEIPRCKLDRTDINTLTTTYNYTLK